MGPRGYTRQARAPWGREPRAAGGAPRSRDLRSLRAAGAVALRMARGEEAPLRPRRVHESLGERLELPRPSPGRSWSGSWRCWSIACSPTRLAGDAACGACGWRRGLREAAAGGTRRRSGRRAPTASACSWRLPKLDELPSPAASLTLRALETGPPAGDQPELDSQAAEKQAQAAGRGGAAGARDRREGRGAAGPRRRRRLAGAGAALAPHAVPGGPRLESRTRSTRRQAGAGGAGADGAPPAVVERSRWRRCGRSGWSRTAGGRRSRCGRHYFELVLADGRNLVVFREHRAGGAGTGSGLSERAERPIRRAARSLRLLLPRRGLDAEELAGAAAELGYEAFALTDHDGVWGSMEFVAGLQQGSGSGRSPGAEVTVSDGSARARST